MVFRLKEKYTIKYLATDGNPVYSYYKFTNKHIITKAETSLIESWNCRLRNCLARLKRKTLYYSKSQKMLRLSILLLFNKELASIVYCKFYLSFFPPFYFSKVPIISRLSLVYGKSLSTIKTFMKQQNNLFKKVQ